MYVPEPSSSSTHKQTNKQTNKHTNTAIANGALQNKHRRTIDAIKGRGGVKRDDVPSNKRDEKGGE